MSNDQWPRPAEVRARMVAFNYAGGVVLLLILCIVLPPEIQGANAALAVRVILAVSAIALAVAGLFRYSPYSPRNRSKRASDEESNE